MSKKLIDARLHNLIGILCDRNPLENTYEK